MAKSSEKASSSMKKFLILILVAVLILAIAAAIVFLVTKFKNDDEPVDELGEVLPKYWGDDPSGIDEDFTGRY